MSVVVRMEMPKNCYLCPMANFFVDKTPYCRLTMRFEGVTQMGCKRPDWCPIICQLPERHGRLADKDEMLKKIENYHRYMTIGRESDPRCIIEDSPTIVPAERSET